MIFTYLRPRPRRCWPIRRIMSWSVWDLIFVDIVLWTSPLISTLSSKGQVPFCKSLLVDAVSPLWQPLLACMLVLTAERRCFFKGGGDTPPSSDSALDARLASNATFLNPLFRFFLNSNDIHQGIIKHPSIEPPSTFVNTANSEISAVASLEQWCHYIGIVGYNSDQMIGPNS